MNILFCPHNDFSNFRRLIYDVEGSEKLAKTVSSNPSRTESPLKLAEITVREGLGALKKTENIMKTPDRPSLNPNSEKESARAKVNLERPQRLATLRPFIVQYAKEAWGKKCEIEKVQLIEAVNLPSQYQKGYEFINDNALAGVMIAIVPDDMWGKGDQPSESSAENGLILFKASYFSGNDDIGWMVHELSHCQRYQNQPDAYSKDSGIYAFDDLGSEYAYPNNKVEAFTFLQQFRYLREQGKTREDIKEMLKADYDEEKDFPFFDKLLDQAFVA